MASRTSSYEQTETRMNTEREKLLPADERKMGKLCCIATSGICGIILLILGILVAVGFDPLVNSYIDKELIIKNGTEVYESWVNPPIVPYLNIYFFNLTNADAFLKGAKPNFKEVGPYSYREHWKKINVSFHDNGTVTYQTKKMYYFERSKSAGPEEDIIHTLNVPVAVAVDRSKNVGAFMQGLLSSMLSVLNETAFVEKSVKDLVWGYSDPLLVLGNRFLPPDKKIPFDKFGFFFEKNGSTDGIFNVYTGEFGIKNYTMIDSFNYSKELKYWNSKECNMVNGTDGTSYPPDLTENDLLYLFNENFCRSIPLVYNNTVQRYGLPGYRYIPPADIFANVSVKPDNECFCVGGPPCIGGGVFNISVCKYNTPIVLSWPHFLDADEKYLAGLTGLKPDALKHALYVDVSPKIGTPLAAQARIQVNVKTTRLDHVKAVSTMTEMVFPIIWFEDGVTTLPDSVVSLLRMSIVVPADLKISFLVIFFIFGGVLVIGSIICYAIIDRKTSATMAITRVLPSYGSSTPIHPSRSSSIESDDGRGHINPAVSPFNPDG